MDIFTCISFHGSGSGAVDDYLREFNNIAYGPRNVEARFIQDPDGISDLFFNICENPHRLNSEYSLKRYLCFAQKNNRTYKQLFGKKWLEITLDYINSLSLFSYSGYWHADEKNFNFLEKVYMNVQKGANRICPLIFRRDSDFDFFPKKKMFQVDFDEVSFLKKTRNYVDNLCNELNIEKKEHILLDQLVPTSNIERYLKFCNSLKVIIVDRDPRDLFIENLLLHNHVLPKNVEQFILNYKYNHEISVLKSRKNILYLHFEDLIYHYDICAKEINSFLNLDMGSHCFIKEKFNPEVSRKNTFLWKRDSSYESEIKQIEKELPEYLYCV